MNKTMLELEEKMALVKQLIARVGHMHPGTLSVAEIWLPCYPNTILYVFPDWDIPRLNSLLLIMSQCSGVWCGCLLFCGAFLLLCLKHAEVIVREGLVCEWHRSKYEWLQITQEYVIFLPEYEEILSRRIT